MRTALAMLASVCAAAVPAAAVHAQARPIDSGAAQAAEEPIPGPLGFWYRLADGGEAPGATVMSGEDQARYRLWSREARQALADRRWADAERILGDTLRLQEATAGPGHAALLGTVAAIGFLYHEQERYDEAIAPWRRLLSLCIANYGPVSGCTASARTNLDGTIKLAARTAADRHAEILHPLDRLPAADVELHSGLAEAVVGARTSGNVAALAPALAARREFEERAFGPGNLRAAITGHDFVTLHIERDMRSADLEAVARAVIRVLARDLPPDSYVVMQAHHNLGVLLMGQGRSVEAEPAIDAALQASRTIFGPYHWETLIHLDAYARVLQDLGRDDEADRMHRETIRAFGQALGDDHPDTLVMKSNYAQFLLELGRLDQAGPALYDSWQRFRDLSGAESSNALAAGASYADFLRWSGRSAEAEPILRELMEAQLRTAGESHRDTPDRIHGYAAVLWDLRRYPEAEHFFSEALRIYLSVRGPDHPRTHLAYDSLAAVRMKMPDRSHLALAPARELWEGVVREQTAAGFDLTGEAGLEGWREGHEPFFRTFADAAWSAGPGLAAEAIAAGAPRLGGAELEALRRDSFNALQEVLIGSPSQAVAQMAARDLAEVTQPGLSDLIRRRRTLSEEWQDNERARLEAVARGAEATQEQIEALRTARSRLEEEALRLDGRIRAAFPRYSAFIRPGPMAPDQAQLLFGADEAGLMIVPTEFGTHIVTVTREGLSWARSDMTRDEVEQAVQALRAELDSSAAVTPSAARPASAGPRSFNRRLAHRLYVELIAPAADHLAGKTHLYIATDGALTSLPFGVLVVAEPVGDDADPAALRATHWMNDAYAIVQIPSLQSLAFLRAISRAAGTGGEARQPFIGFGDPLLARPSPLRPARAPIGVRRAGSPACRAPASRSSCCARPLVHRNGRSICARTRPSASSAPSTCRARRSSLSPPTRCSLARPPA